MDYATLATVRTYMLRKPKASSYTQRFFSLPERPPRQVSDFGYVPQDMGEKPSRLFDTFLYNAAIRTKVRATDMTFTDKIYTHRKAHKMLTRPFVSHLVWSLRVSAERAK